MINYFKPFKITSKDIANLKNVNPYWKKNVLKNLKKLHKWIIKFSQDPKNFKINYPEKYDVYDVFFQQIDNYLNFYNQKFKKISTNAKLLIKFYKFIADYVDILGWTKSIELICQFYDDIAVKDVENKQKHALRIVNSCIITFFEIFKKNILKLIKQDEYLEKLFEAIYSKEEAIININFIIKETLKYTKLLFKKKKINEATLVEVSINSIEIIVFINSITHYFANFLVNVK